jgi:hypothetical protein
VRPANYNSLLTQGDIVRVRLRRETALAALDYHDFLYEIERIEKTASGACIFDLTHFPIDVQGRSLVALEVAAATAPGVAIASGRSDYSCDDNSSTPGTAVGSGGIDFPAFDETPDFADTTVDIDVPTDDEWATGGYPPVGPDVSQPAGEPTGGQTPVGGWDNPSDPLDQTLDQDGVGYITGGTGTGAAPLPGDTLSVSDSDFTCAGQVCWSKINKDTGVETDISCQDEPISGSWDLSITTDEIDHYIVATGRCKDPSTASGWGAPQSLGQTAAVVCAPASAPYGGNISGTVPPPGTTVGATLRIFLTGGITVSYNTPACDPNATTTFDSSFATGLKVTSSNVIGVQFMQDMGTCGPTNFYFVITRSVAPFTITRFVGVSTTYGIISTTESIQLEWDGPTAVNYVVPCA